MSTETPPEEATATGKPGSSRKQLIKTIGMIAAAAIATGAMTFGLMAFVEKKELAKKSPAKSTASSEHTNEAAHARTATAHAPAVAAHGTEAKAAPHAEPAKENHAAGVTEHAAPAQRAPPAAAHSPDHSKAAPTEHSASSSELFTKLMEGNKRYLANGATHPNQSTARRIEVSIAQKPFAIILACADSRVSPEIIFDQGLGDLFVVRVAGNVVDNHVLGSLEYAAEHFGTGLIVVLGHERCGAVTAALAGGHAPGHIGSIIEALKPAVDRISGKGGDAVDRAIDENVKIVVQALRATEPILKEKVVAHHLEIVGARYDLDTGVVTSVEP
ncbi:MAG: carbonic anhydrase [Pedosphaera sp.]|nr:carbonic anhydrase [Pedosphaera sp.]